MKEFQKKIFANTDGFTVKAMAELLNGLVEKGFGATPFNRYEHSEGKTYLLGYPITMVSLEQDDDADDLDLLFCIYPKQTRQL